LGILLFLIIAAAAPALGYVGPGAGFGIVTSFLVFVNALGVSLLSFLFWPVLALVRRVRMSRRPLKPVAKRLVVLGLDGLSPLLVERMWEKGELPNLKRLAEQGSFRHLGTTTPGVSPVAWSTFQTGVNPGKHGIYDFLAPDRKRYLAALSSVRTGTSVKRVFPGIRRRVTEQVLLRKSRPFWSYLGRYGVRSSVIRVPITFPPEPLDGHLLSGMCVPDLRGSQGSYTFLTRGEPVGITGGIQGRLIPRGRGIWTGEIPGPEGASPGRISLRNRRGKTLLKHSCGQVRLEVDRLSPWTAMEFRLGRKKVRGIARFRLTEGPNLYCTALHVDPSSPAVPLGHPVHYSRYLAGIQGPFATLGLAEDTWALSNGHLDDDSFMEMCRDIFRERERMFMGALSRNRSGLVVCVFDTPDRVSHMFWGRGFRPGSPIRSTYAEMDGLVGRVAARLGRHDRLVVLSDHGFAPFHTCVDFNRWLVENGYMVLEPGTETVEDSFHGVDWDKTRAYSLGLAGININLAGREGRGIVAPGDAPALAEEIARKLESLTAPGGERVVRKARLGREEYSGPYVSEGPDVIPGTARGFRAGWKCVTGGVGPQVLYPNDRHWNGDHSCDPDLVKGVLFTSWKIGKENPTIADIAPTALTVLGVAPPRHMDGSPL
jgi:predicted AlkP superfamily phosphohydrolase/phosphomutase